MSPETVAALKQQTGARVVVLGPVPAWRRGLPNEVLRYYLLHHRLIPARWNDGGSEPAPTMPSCATALVPKGRGIYFRAGGAVQRRGLPDAAWR